MKDVLGHADDRIRLMATQKDHRWVCRQGQNRVSGAAFCVSSSAFFTCAITTLLSLGTSKCSWLPMRLCWPRMAKAGVGRSWRVSQAWALELYEEMGKSSAQVTTFNGLHLYSSLPAMAMEVPVIATNWSGPTQFIKVGGHVDTHGQQGAP